MAERKVLLSASRPLTNLHRVFPILGIASRAALRDALAAYDSSHAGRER
jgi:hypothetical protein